VTTVRRVLVARLDNVGDVLLAGPLIRAVAARAQVTLLCGPVGGPAGRLLPGVAEVLTFDAPWVGFDPAPVDAADIARLVARVETGRFDAGIVLTSFHQSPLPLALLLRLAGVPHLSATSVDYPGSLLDVRHAPRPELHEVAESLSLAAAAGFPLPPGDDGRLALRSRPPRSGWAGAAFDGGAFDDDGGGAGDGDERHRPYVVVHPGASVPARAIPAALAASTTRALARRGWGVAVTGTAAEAATGVALEPDPGRVVDLRGRLDLAQLADVVQGAAAVVSGNTGPAHLAAATGTPVVSIFAPVVPAHRWRPWGVDHVLLGDQHIDCAGCRARRCPFEGQPCVAAITADDVVDAVEQLAAAAPDRSGPPLAVGGPEGWAAR
jgi:ADP-heptose:LPS heptosyltransferase